MLKGDHPLRYGNSFIDRVSLVNEDEPYMNEPVEKPSTVIYAATQQ